MIERLFLPDRPGAPQSTIDHMRRCSLNRAHDLNQRNNIPVLFIDAWGEDQVCVIGHHDCHIEFVFFAMIVIAAGQSHIPSAIGQNPAEFCDERDEVRCEVLLQVREVAAVELHTRIVAW